MSNLAIFGLGLFVTLLLAAGLFFTVMEFRDIDRHPEQHYPKSFRKKSLSERDYHQSGAQLERAGDGTQVM